MKKKLVIIGGGENGRLLENGEFAPYETGPMDREIVRLTEKDKPNFLFIGHAMNFSIEIQESYYQTMKKIYSENFGCNCRDLKSNELTDWEKVKEKIEWADIIYEGGGDTASMIKLWKESGFDKLLYKAWNDGKVICGISAGASCWFKSCNSDSGTNQAGVLFKCIDCLGWISAHLTPHCNEKGRYESTKQQLKENDLLGIMLSNCAALEILDNQYRMIVSDTKNGNKPFGIKVYWSKGEYVEEKIMPFYELKNIEELLGAK